MKSAYFLMRQTSVVLAWAVLSIGNAYGHNNTEVSDTTRVTCMDQAARQLDETLLLVQKNYYKKDSVQWNALIVAAKERLALSGNCEAAFETVNWCFRQMSESHSFIMPAGKAAIYNNAPELKQKPYMTQLVGEIKGNIYYGKGIAYLTLPWVGTTDSAICTAIADSLQQLIATLDQQGVSKWIIDLRKNTGGNCWPMLAGIGPLLGEGVCGYFVSGSQKIPISYRDGAALQGNNVRCRVSFNAYNTRNKKNWVVVLTGPRTSSSGEIVALAFKGKEQAYLYGEPTAGLTTANTTYTLSDRSMLVLTVCREADRYGNIVEGKITPDTIISTARDNALDDAVLSAAVMWLHIQ